MADKTEVKEKKVAKSPKKSSSFHPEKSTATEIADYIQQTYVEYKEPLGSQFNEKDSYFVQLGYLNAYKGLQPWNGKRKELKSKLIEFGQYHLIAKFGPDVKSYECEHGILSRKFSHSEKKKNALGAGWTLITGSLLNKMYGDVLKSLFTECV
jgi:hypothetical protein